VNNVGDEDDDIEGTADLGVQDPTPEVDRDSAKNVSDRELQQGPSSAGAASRQPIAGAVVPGSTYTRFPVGVDGKGVSCRQPQGGFACQDPCSGFAPQEEEREKIVMSRTRQHT
jgi:hypothetical protein